MAVDGHLNFDTKINETGFKKGLKSLDSGLDSIKSKLAGVGAALAAAFSAKEIIETAAEVKALGSQFSQTFGVLQDNANAVIKSISDNSGILETRLKSTASSIYAFAKTAGMDSADAMNLMNEALQVTADSAAYYDRSLEETAETLKSYLKGNFANDAALGLSSTEATRNAKALEMFGKKYNELSEAQKQLALLQMVKDANALSGAMGQAAREADGWENVLGNLKEAWKQLIAVVGQPVLALAVPVVKQLTQLMQTLTEQVRGVVNALGEVFGIDLGNASSELSDNAETAAESYDDMAQAAEAAEEANEGSLASFDEINKIGGEDSGTASETPAGSALSGGTLPLTVTADTAEADEKIVSFLTKVKKGFAKARDFIIKAFSKVRTWLSDNFGGIFDRIFDGLAAEGEELLGTLSGIFSDVSSLAVPLKSWLKNDLTPYWQAEFTTLGNIATGLFDSVNKVFSDIWNIAVFPILSNFVTDGLPMITQFGTEMWTTFDTLFTGIKTLFDKLWSEYAAPVLGLLTEVWTDTVSILKAKWDEYGKPIFDGLRETIKNVSEQIKTLLDEWVKPVFDYAMEAADELWNDHLSPLLDDILGLAGDVILAAQNIYNKAIAPVVRWVTMKLAPIVTTIGKTLVDGIKKRVANVTDLFRGIVTFLRGVFTLNLSTAWAGICQVFASAWEIIKSAFGLDKVKEFFGGVVDAIADIFSGLGELLKAPINAVIDAINGAFGMLNSLSIDIPTGINKTTTIGFDIPEIPRLAQGTVIPANYGEFLAVLGDNRREAEVVSPVSAIKQAVMEAAVELGGVGQGGSKQPVIVQIMLDKRVVGQAAIDDINGRSKRNGRSPLI